MTVIYMFWCPACEDAWAVPAGEIDSPRGTCNKCGRALEISTMEATADG